VGERTQRAPRTVFPVLVVMEAGYAYAGEKGQQAKRDRSSSNQSLPRWPVAGVNERHTETV
jgi:hypothetical protein